MAGESKLMFKELSRTGEKLTAIGIGTWKMSKSDGSVRAIQAGLDEGSNFVDTAEYYMNEEMVGKAIRDRDVFLATKVFPTHFKYEAVLKSCERSLSKLGRKSIDLYQLHWPNRHVPITETMRAMEKLVDDGKIRYIGVSNFYLDELREAQEAMKKYEIVSNQVEYSPMVTDIEKELLPYCQKEKISVIAYSPLKHGSAMNILSSRESAIPKIAESHGASVPQVILRWIISKDSVFAIPKSSSPERVRENVRSMGLDLSDQEIEEINDSVKSFKFASTRSKFGPFISFFSRF